MEMSDCRLQAQWGVGRILQWVSDIFFAGYPLLSTYVCWWLLSGRDGMGVVGGGSTLFRDVTAAIVYSSVFAMGCLVWSSVYAAELLVCARRRVFWQLAIVALPNVGPSLFYVCCLRARWSSIALRLLRPQVYVFGIMSGGLVGAATVLVALGMQTPCSIAIAGSGFAGAVWGARYWFGSDRGVDALFSALTGSAAAGVIFGLAARGLLVPIGLGARGEALAALASAYWGATATAFATCVTVVVPGLGIAPLRRHRRKANSPK